MENIVLIVHVLVALAIIGLILLQQGKGAEAGASFGGGASQTLFGSQGGGNFFAKLTGILAVIFFATSFSLAVIAKNTASISLGASGLPVVEELQPESEVPTINGSESVNSATDIPVVAPEGSSVDSDAPVVSRQ
ncbi:MAG: preprotein translocase subunit SecG [Cellvibrionaceae bacterium]|jgi:preprotein translocase subunit SecG